MSTAEQEYSRGVAAKNAKNWSAAVGSFQKAVSLEPGYPEAWNELGFALRNQGNYPDSLKAHDDALRLRPDFPEALEYLGEACVKLGRVDDAQTVLERLKPLDAARAAEPSEAIAKGKSRRPLARARGIEELDLVRGHRYADAAGAEGFHE